MRLVINGTPVALAGGDDVLTAALRHGLTPPGTLCGAGDCPNCLATVDGVAFTRMCRTPARPGMVVTFQPVAPAPAPELPTAPLGLPVSSRLVTTGVAVVGGGQAGRAEAERLRAAGHDVTVFDEADGAEVAGLYEGPELLVRTPEGMLRVEVDHEVVVATGAAEIHPVCPGNRLTGIVTARAATRLAAAGVPLGHVVAVGQPPQPVPDLDLEVVAGTLVRFEGGPPGGTAPVEATGPTTGATSGATGPTEATGGAAEPTTAATAPTAERVTAVVVRDADGIERRYRCDTVSVGLGLTPRNVLAGMGTGLAVRAVGRAAEPGTLPPAPTEGVVCPCSGTTVAELQGVWDRGFHELELVKRASLCGTGTCQGSVCMPHVRAFMARRGVATDGSFTPRPLVRQITMAEAAAGWSPPAFRRTMLDGEHRALGARMDRFGGWWRPWRYGDPAQEYWAVREGVSLGDVGTLGRFIVSGPDVVSFLERLYPARIADLKPGRSRYTLNLAESGAVLDDGMVCRVDEHRFILTFTSGGASLAEAWMRDWAATFGHRVHLLDRTHAWGAVNVTGPLAGELLTRAGIDQPLPGFLAHREQPVAGVPARVFRLSFTGELSYEVHHPVDRSVELWRRLMAAGRDLGVKPHGIDVLFTLRLEKGHVIVGMDTEADSTPRRLGLEWAVAPDKDYFIGRAALERTARLPLDRRLRGLVMDGPAPDEGTVIRSGPGPAAAYVGYVSSSRFSPGLGHTVMLGWVAVGDDGEPPDHLHIEGRPARIAPTPFYDPEGHRARA